MTRRNGLRAAALIALILTASAVLLPLAQADHAYSHRYIVFGRVVDAAGNPVPGLTVNMGSPEGDRNFEPEGPCADQPNTETEAFGPTRTRPVTNEFGEFVYCFHTHQMSRILPPALTIAVDGTNYENEFEMDAYRRHSFVPIVLDEVRPDANTDILDSTYTLQGTAWRQGSRDDNLEGVRVFGFTVDQAPVNVTFTYNGKAPMQLSSTTNNYGDWAIRVPVEERVESGTVAVTINGQTFTEELNATLGTTHVASYFEKNSVPVPGAAVALAGILAAVAIVGLVAGGRRGRS